ncbi:NnrS family protein [Hyphomicrobium sp.]|uniref:NnrS family protein n=1 Tax=Hyphomicrobium sp. TaxID=82 RepID=UPI002E331033|nr:NnrS family protein [Hyphomicrobium sp.]HEX2842351.1 NnrS family protein [Hyphomicrobium sp.]
MTISHVPQSPSSAPPSAARPSFEALFSYGFRPFFLGAAIHAVLVMTLWIAWIAWATAGWTQDWLPVAGSPYAWHAHEMVFGFAAAAIAGFLLTAVPNWTGALPLSGLPLAVVFVAWLVGRVAMGASALMPYPLAAALDLLFLPTLGGVAARQLFARSTLRNLVFLGLVAGMTVCNGLFHLGNGGYIDVDPLAATRAAMLIVIVMIAIIGGRIIPAFTHNWLNGKRPPLPMPQRIPWLDRSALASLVVFAVFEASGVSGMLLGTVALCAAVANGARLALWRGIATRSEPIVWILHIAYAWIVLALALAALASFGGGVPLPLVSHAFGTGAIGTMILAIMSRASLGHTGRRIVASRAIVVAYHLVTLSAVLRIGGPLLAPEYAAPLLAAAGLAWIGAFLLFAIVYAPILTTPRVHTKLAH